MASASKSVAEIAEEAGVCQATLYRWRHAVILQGVSDDQATSGKRGDAWTLKEKLTLLLEASELSDEELGAFLRQKGLHGAELDEWREALEGSGKGTSTSKKKKSASKRIRDLERELKRKEKALAEAAALLVLQKKVQDIWGDEDDDTNEGSE